MQQATAQQKRITVQHRIVTSEHLSPLLRSLVGATLVAHSQAVKVGGLVQSCVITHSLGSFAALAVLGLFLCWWLIRRRATKRGKLLVCEQHVSFCYITPCAPRPPPSPVKQITLRLGSTCKHICVPSHYPFACFRNLLPVAVPCRMFLHSLPVHLRVTVSQLPAHHCTVIQVCLACLDGTPPKANTQAETDMTMRTDNEPLANTNQPDMPQADLSTNHFHAVPLFPLTSNTCVARASRRLKFAHYRYRQSNCVRVFSLLHTRLHGATSQRSYLRFRIELVSLSGVRAFVCESRKHHTLDSLVRMVINSGILHPADVCLDTGEPLAGVSKLPLALNAPLLYKCYAAVLTCSFCAQKVHNNLVSLAFSPISNVREFTPVVVRPTADHDISAHSVTCLFHTQFAHLQCPRLAFELPLIPMPQEDPITVVLYRRGIGLHQSPIKVFFLELCPLDNYLILDAHLSHGPPRSRHTLINRIPQYVLPRHSDLYPNHSVKGSEVELFEFFPCTTRSKPRVQHTVDVVVGAQVHSSFTHRNEEPPFGSNASTHSPHFVVDAYITLANLEYYLIDKVWLCPPLTLAFVVKLIGMPSRWTDQSPLWHFGDLIHVVENQRRKQMT